MPQKKKTLDVAGKKQQRRTLPNGKTVFAPGVSGNPAGRPPGVRNFTTMIRESLIKLSQAKDENGVQMSYEATLAKTVLKKAIVDEDVGMIKLIWNYLDGMPVQPLGNPDGTNFSALPDPETQQQILKAFGINESVKNTQHGNKTRD